MSGFTHLVFEFGFAHRDEFDRALRLLDPVSDSALARRSSGDEAADMSIADALSGLAHHSLSAVQWTSARDGVRWIEIRGPHTQSVAPVPWLLSFEYDRRDWESTFDKIVGTGCLFGVVSIEESLEDLVAAPATGEALPWHDWRLVLGYVESGGNGAPLRKFGPGFDRIKDVPE